MVDTVKPEGNTFRLLDVCCGTGSVALAFRKAYPESFVIGFDFSRGMLRKAQQKATDQRMSFIEGDAAELPFSNNSLDVITCSHALYELKGAAREKALLEMKRVMRSSGMVLIMEHAVPQNRFVRLLFYLRMAAMGTADAREFVKEGKKPFEKVFANVSVVTTPSEKSRLFICRN